MATTEQAGGTGQGGGGRPGDGAGGKAWGKLLGGLLGLAVLAVVAVALVGPVREQLVDAVSGLGNAGPVVFVALYVALSLLLVPTTVLIVASGILFGPWLGAGLAVVGGVLSAAIGLLVGRRIGRGPIERVAGGRLDKIDRWLRHHGLMTIAVARVIPALPFGVMNYAAGLTGIPARRFVGGTALGVVPGSLVYAGFGGRLDDIGSPLFWGAVLAMVVLSVGGLLLEQRMGPPDE